LVAGTNTIVSLSGLRGGVGTTSLTALLADALRNMGESVLVVDLNYADLLRLHFDVQYSSKKGWFGVLDNLADWESQIHEIDEGFWLLPYGRNVRHDRRASRRQCDALWQLLVQESALLQTRLNPQWVLFDAPTEPFVSAELFLLSDYHFLVCEVDIAAHVLLNQKTVHEKSYLLLNKFNPDDQLGSDIVLDWNMRYGEQVLPVSFYQDSHIPQSLAHKSTAVSHFIGSSAAQNARVLAHWCLAQRRE